MDGSSETAEELTDTRQGEHILLAEVVGDLVELLVREAGQRRARVVLGVTSYGRGPGSKWSV